MLKTINGGKAPTRATKYSAAVDLFASEDCIISAGETKIIGLGVCIDLDEFINKNLNLFEMNFYESCENGDDGSHYAVCGEKVNNFTSSHYLELHPRSSLRAKGLISGVGVIDLDYAQEIKIIIHNPLQKYIIKEKGIDRGYVKQTNYYKIKKGDKIAQILLKEHKGYLMGITSNEERTGGIGSTDK